MNSIKDIKFRMDAVKVVAVTCLGINSPLLANKRFDVCIMDEAGQTTLPVRFLISEFWLLLEYADGESCGSPFLILADISYCSLRRKIVAV